MPHTLSAVSQRRLQGVHPDLVKVVELAITLTTQDFRVIEGLRTHERQAHLVRKGASRTMKSRHLTGHLPHQNLARFLLLNGSAPTTTSSGFKNFLLPLLVFF